MTVGELLERLIHLDPEAKVLIRDYNNCMDEFPRSAASEVVVVEGRKEVVIE